MNIVRKYGNAPYKCAVIHGGPGGAGEMEPVARELSGHFGVLEPIQNAKTVQGQIDELEMIIGSEADRPLVLAGHSWGAWLALLCAARRPDIVCKCILISSGPFEEKYAEKIAQHRLSKLDEHEQREYFTLLDRLNGDKSVNKDEALSRLGALATRADIHEQRADAPLSTPAGELTEDPGEIFAKVWPEAAKLRRTGKLLQAVKKISCPVAIIHGERDSHPGEGVIAPLSAHIDKLKSYVLSRCGHYPWLEKHAWDKFYEILRMEIDTEIF